MPRIQTDEGVKEFEYTPGGMAAAQRAAAEQMVRSQGQDYGKMATGGAMGALQGAASGYGIGGPPGAIIGGVLGGIGGAAGASQQDIKGVGAAGQELKDAWEKRKAAADALAATQKIAGEG